MRTASAARQKFDQHLADDPSPSSSDGRTLPNFVTEELHGFLACGNKQVRPFCLRAAISTSGAVRHLALARHAGEVRAAGAAIRA